MPGVRPGDFILTHSAHFTGRLIRFGQRLRWRGARRPFAYFNHAAMVISADGDLVEALSRGVGLSHLSKYRWREYVVVSPPFCEVSRDRLLLHRSTEETNPDVGVAMRGNAAYFAEHAIGRRYGYLELVSLAITLLTGAKLAVGVDNQMICSGLVAEALTRLGPIFPDEPYRTMPAGLAEFYRVGPPRP